MSSQVATAQEALETERALLLEAVGQAGEQCGADAADWADVGRRIDRVDVAGPDALAAERELDAAARRMRSLLLARGHRIDEAFERSPDLSLDRTLPGGEPLRHSYERNLPAASVERRLAARCPTLPEGWSRRTVAFSSGMAAISQVVQGLTYLMTPSAQRPLHLGFWGDYFETDVLLEFLSGPALRPRKLGPGDLSAIWPDPAAPDVLLIEPVRYNWSLDVLDVGGLVNGWRRGPGRPPVIVLDTTLTSPSWPTAAFLGALASPAGVPLVIEVRSGLKLDQQGLEVANLGVVDVFQHRDSVIPELTAQRLAQTLELARGTSGLALPAAAVAALDAPFLLDERWTRLHSGRVFLHNARLAQRLSGLDGGLFTRVAHPSLSSHGWPANSPFVVLHLREDSLEDHGLLLAVIRDEARRRGLGVVYGSSFGFRTTRFETVVPRKSQGAGLFKVAAGARGGPSLDRFCDLLLDIGGFPSMAKLRETHATVPVRLA